MREPDLISLSAVSALALQTGRKTAALLKQNRHISDSLCGSVRCYQRVDKRVCQYLYCRLLLPFTIIYLSTTTKTTKVSSGSLSLIRQEQVQGFHSP